MGLHDTFDFDAAAYRTLCAERLTAKLQEEEIKKLRQHFAASASVTLGVANLVPSSGLSLGVSVYGLRRYYIAQAKLALIRAELTARNVALHDVTKRDAAIPLSAFAVGIGLGHGIVPPAVVSAFGGGEVLQFIQADPSAAAHGFAQGLQDQSNAVGEAAVPGPGAVPGHGAEQLASATSGDAAGGMAVMYAAGLLATTKMQKMIAEYVGEVVFAYAMEKLLDPEIKIELKLRGRCTRLQGPLGQYCRGCGEAIRRGKYAHCCQETDDFDLCLKCRDLGTRCACVDKQMLTLQKSVAGDVLFSEEGDRRRRMASLPEIRCTPCHRVISQGRYYYCPECSENGVDICQDCYGGGQTCQSPDTHRLYVYLRANVDQARSDLATDDICCKACSHKIMQGPVYLCAECGEASGICDRCYDMEKSCGDTSHILSRYVVYKGEKSIRRALTEKDCCQFCKTALGTGTFYCCKQCGDGCYDLCETCYVRGAGCADRTHSLLKCTPAAARDRFGQSM